MNDSIQTDNRIIGQRRWWALTAVLVTMFFSSMDQTVVATAMPVIIGQLQGFTYYAWVFTAYVMASAVTVPIYGKLSDIYGRKPFYIFGLIVFMLGSAISGQAHSMLELVAARAGQGIGAGAMLTMPRATIGDIFNPRERGRWMGVIGAVFGLASIIGPNLGGWITDAWGWRWVFYINLPFAAIALVMVWLTLPNVKTGHRAMPDLGGSAILVVGLLSVLLGFTWGGSKFAWGSWQEVALFAFGVLALTAFGLYETRVREPIINPALFNNPIFSSTIVVGLMLSMGLFGSLMFLPLFVQGVMGLSALGSGAVLTPMMLAFIVGSIVSGQIMTHTGRYKLQARISAAVMIVGMLLLSRMSAATTYPTVIVDMVVLGLGVGALMPLLTVVVQNAFPYAMLGQINSAQQFSMSLGGVIAVPILGSVMVASFNNLLPKYLPPTLRNAVAVMSHRKGGGVNPQSLTNAANQHAISRSFAVFGAQGTTLYHQFIFALHQALAQSLVEVFHVGLAFSVAALIGTFFLKEVRLKHEEFFTSEQSPSSVEAGEAG